MKCEVDNMKAKQIVYMVSIGWNLSDIRFLCKQSKEIERQLVLKKRYDNKYKIVDFFGIEKYYCIKHKGFHKKYRYTNRYGKVIKLETHSFKKCKDNAYSIPQSEFFAIQIKKSFNSYSIEKHKKISGSRKQ